jgi:hypothetical protein
MNMGLIQSVDSACSAHLYTVSVTIFVHIVVQTKHNSGCAWTQLQMYVEFHWTECFLHAQDKQKKYNPVEL